MRVPYQKVPVVVICRDRLHPTRILVQWLERAGHERIILVDNDSHYEPFVDYLNGSPHSVIRLSRNIGPHEAVWGSDALAEVRILGDYVVTDCDVVPDDSCPNDLVEYLGWVLERFPQHLKAGPALRIDDLPESYSMRDLVRRHEKQFWQRPLGHGLFNAWIDTTFARYRADQPFDWQPAIRTGKPYWARHLAWYEDLTCPTDEERFYRDHRMSNISHWGLDAIGHVSEVDGLSVAQRIRWNVYSRWIVARSRTSHRKFRPATRGEC